MDSTTTPLLLDMLTGAVLTIPSLVWLTHRFAKILHKQHKAIRHHLKEAIPNPKRSSTTSSSSHLAFAMHVILGLGLGCVAPYLAYRCAAPPAAQQQQQQQEPLLLLLWDRTLLLITSVVLIVANLSVFWLVPHPSRHKSYRATSPRQFCRGLGLLHVASLQFAVMAWMPLAFLLTTTPRTSSSLFVSSSASENATTNNNNMMTLIRATILATGVAVYLWTLAVCLGELLKRPWEGWSISQRLIVPQLLPHGPRHTKSKLTMALVHGDPTAQQAILYSYFVLGSLAMLQSVAMLVTTLQQSNSTDPHIQDERLEEFFVVNSLYLTVVQSCGFFTQAQTLFEAQDKLYEPKWRKQILLEVGLTQVLPVLVTCLADRWMTKTEEGNLSLGEFSYRYFLWRPYNEY